MSQTAHRAPAEDPPTDRQARVLDAAEQCFVRAGFHRTTMQDVAAAAGMSPGNLYRYFASKDALIAGLCARDRVGMADEFAAARTTVGDFLAIFATLGRKHFEEEPREKAVLCLEIWAEATRNAEIAALNAELERDIVGHMTDLFEAARAAGSLPPGLNIPAVVRIVHKLASGLFVRRALAPDFNPAEEIGEVFAVIGALLKGAIDLSPPNLSECPSCS